MQRSGYELLAITDELRARPDLITIRQWDWEKLRSFWKDQADVELERLLPEAKDVFLEMLPAIAGSVTRYQVKNLIRDGQLSVVQPKAAGQLDSEDLSTIAVGPVLIKDRASETTESYVRDNTGLNCLHIMGYPEGQWAEVANRFLIWRPQSFEVLSSPWRRESAAPMFADSRFNSLASPIGWFWSSEKDPENLPVDCNTEKSPEAEPKIRVFYRWYLREGALSFSINSFALTHSRPVEDCNLQVAQSKIWSGEVPDQSWIKLNERIRLNDPRQDIEVRLVCDERTIASRVFTNPIAGGAALFFGRLCAPEVFLNEADLDRVWLIADEYSGRPKTKGFDVQPRETSSFTAAGLSVYQFTLSSDAPVSRWISMGHRQWKIRVGPFAELVPSLPDPLEYKGVRVVSSGAIQPVSRESDLHLTLDVPSRWAGALSGRNQLLIESAGRQLTVDLSEVLHDGSSAGRTEVSLSSLIDQRKFVPDFGVIDISLRGPDVSPFVSVKAFFIDGEVSIARCAFGERSKLTIRNRGRTDFSITATNTTSFDMQSGNASKARALVSLAEDEQLWLTWQPQVSDIAIVTGNDPVGIDQVKLFDQERTFHLTRIGEVQDTFCLRLNDEFDRPFTEERIDVCELFAEWQPRLPHQASEATLTVINSETANKIKEWLIDFTPKVEVTATHWAEKIGGSTVVVHYQAAGLPGQEIHFDVNNSVGEREVSKTVKVTDSQASLLEIAWSGLLYEGDFTLVVTGCGVELARAQLPQPPESGEPDIEKLRAGIRKNMEAWQSETSQAMQLLHLYDQYVAIAGVVPWPAMKVSRRICRSGMSETEEQVGHGLLFLEYISAGKEVDFDIGQPSMNSELDVFLATLALGEQLRLYGRGLMIPSIVDDLRAAFETASARKVKKYWSDSMIQICDGFSPSQSTQKDSSMKSQIESALNRPLVLADKGLLRSLENLLEGRKE